jgi:DNA-binding response OmpR family regulator
MSTSLLGRINCSPECELHLATICRSRARRIFVQAIPLLDLVIRIVRDGERDVKLSLKEYALLRVLVQHAGKVLSYNFFAGEALE